MRLPATVVALDTGLVSTARGLLFGGSNEGYVFALDGATGNLHWRFPAGGAPSRTPSATGATAISTSPSPRATP